MKMRPTKITKSILFLLVVIISSLFILSQSSGLELKEKSEFKYSGLNNKGFLSAEFTHTEFAQNQLSKNVPFSKSKLRLKYKSGITKEISLDYKTLFRSGDSIGEGQAGLVKNIYDEPIVEWGNSAEGLRIRPGTIFLSGIDGSSLIFPVGHRPEGVSGNPLYLVTHFEHRSWIESNQPDGLPVSVERDLPLALNLTLIDQNLDSGHLEPVRLQNIDLSGIGGVWFPCASSRTPWNTHLGSEEYEPDAKWFEHRPFEALNRYFGTPGMISVQDGANPYNYGFPIEVVVDGEGKPRVFKRYAMGRISLEMGQVMPDEKTVYLTDDGYDVVRLMFIADRPRDLSSGTLYAARWDQVSGKNGGEANLRWIRLGHGNEKEIRKWINKRITFSEIFDWVEPSFYKASVYQNFKPVYVYQGFRTKPAYPHDEIKDLFSAELEEQRKSYLKPFEVNELDTKLQYLKVKPEMDEVAAFLETRKYAALKGATTEFTKLEGQALNISDRKLYTVSSKVKLGMLKGNNGLRSQDHIELSGKKQDLACGIIYESELKTKVSDTEGKLISSKWVAVNMKPLLTSRGLELENGKKVCNPDYIGNPDNIVYSEKFRHLFIAEDSSGRHERNFLWAYSIDAKKLSRILIAPEYAEVSGLHISENVNNYWYLLASFQKDPDLNFLYFGESRNEINKRLRNGYINGISGYLSPIFLQPSH